MTTEERMKPVTELFEQAMKNYEQALKTGLKLQEESGKWWTNLLGQTSSPQDWQKRAKALADELLPQTQKGIDECLKLVEQNSRVSLDLLKKASNLAQSASPAEAQTKFLSFWETSLNALRDTAQTVTQANTKAMEAWTDFVRKSTEPVTATRAKG